MDIAVRTDAVTYSIVGLRHHGPDHEPLFVGTLNEHYVDSNERFKDSYHCWHELALVELSGRSDAELEPMVVEIDGFQHRFTGTAEAHYEEWRELPRQLFKHATTQRGRARTALVRVVGDERARDGH